MIETDNNSVYSNIKKTGSSFCLQEKVQNLNAKSMGMVMACNYLETYYYSYDIENKKALEKCRVYLNRPLDVFRGGTPPVDHAGRQLITKISSIITRVGKKGKNRITFVNIYMPVISSPVFKAIGSYLEEKATLHLVRVGHAKNKENSINLFYKPTTPFAPINTFNGKSAEYNWLVHDANPLEFYLNSLCRLGQLVKVNRQMKSIKDYTKRVNKTKTVSTYGAALDPVHNFNNESLFGLVNDYIQLTRNGELNYNYTTARADEVFHASANRELLFNRLQKERATTAKNQIALLSNTLCGLLDCVNTILALLKDNTENKLRSEINMLFSFLTLAILSLNNAFVNGRNEKEAQRLLKLRCALINRFI